MHLITTVYTTVVRTRECVCLREAGGVGCGIDSQAVLPAGRVTSVVCMRGCVAVVLISYLTFYYKYV